ncbi:tripartite tricarboxylate transporter TctB family protein [Paenibacillus sp. YYML68]|uniref:tripartite tricarboxylate transporter TctB family protein n=1 Tax=Paenibacillus sp. YYML68 TaxID=2909250 RepID=UPI002491485A|nr:tripartite tricarboxylate transporter TctB family protein [Paenibacillus sp. YYML68]
MKWKHNVGFYMSLMFIALSGSMFWKSWELDYYSSLGPGPGLFPRWLAGAMLLLSLLYAFSSLRQPIVWSEVMPKGRDMRNVLTVLASVVVFVLVMTPIGFVLAGFLMMTFLLSRAYPWHRSAGIAITVNVAIYLMFDSWLNVPLPSGQIWDWVG